MPYTPIPSGSSTTETAIGPRDTYRDIGSGLLGITAANGWELFENFMALPANNAAPAAWVQTATNGSSVNQITGTQVTSRLRTTAAANSTCDQGTNVYLGHQGTNKWYYAARFKVPTAIDAQARVVHAMNTAGGNTCGIGVMGPINTTNFVAYRDSVGFAGGTQLDLGVAIDTAYHTFELWCGGDSVLKARIDGGTIVSATQTAAEADMFLYHTCRNGTTAADRHMDRRWCYWLVEVT